MGHLKPAPAPKRAPRRIRRRRSTAPELVMPKVQRTLVSTTFTFPYAFRWRHWNSFYFLVQTRLLEKRDEKGWPAPVPIASMHFNQVAGSGKNGELAVKYTNIHMLVEARHEGTWEDEVQKCIRTIVRNNSHDLIRVKRTKASCHCLQ